MIAYLGAALALVALLAGCGNDGAPQYSGGPPPVAEVYGQCSFCHNELATNMVAFGGHSSLRVKCERCHAEDLTPGVVGPHHRSTPRCADCHAEQATHMDPAAGTPSECVVCHTPHGSPNLFLVNQQVTDPSGIAHDIDFTRIAGRTDGGLAGASAPGTGLCEVCHTATEFYRSDGTGSAHFTDTCVVCHTHAGAFAPF